MYMIQEHQRQQQEAAAAAAAAAQAAASVAPPTVGASPAPLVGGDTGPAGDPLPGASAGAGVRIEQETRRRRSQVASLRIGPAQPGGRAGVGVRGV